LARDERVIHISDIVNGMPMLLSIFMQLFQGLIFTSGFNLLG